MPGGFPAGFNICNGQSIGAVTASSRGTVITASSSTNTKGSYTSLITSTAYDCCYAVVNIINGAATLGLVDIAVGTSGNQQVIIPNIFLGAVAGTSAAKVNFCIALPINIPAGTNIWARSQSATASTTYDVSMILFDGEFTGLPGLAGYDDLGTSLSTSLGVAITPSATGSVLGTWTSVVTATARDYVGLWGTLGFGTVNDTYLMNIGIGGSGSQVIIIPNFASYNINAAGVSSGGTLPFLPIEIPKGTEIWAQTQASGTSAAGLNVILYGGYQ
jgi:hypothetical protein